MFCSHGEWNKVGIQNLRAMLEQFSSICFILNDPVLVVSNVTGAHKSHELHYGYLSKRESVDLLSVRVWGVQSFMIVEVKTETTFVWYAGIIKFPLSWQETWHRLLNLFVSIKQNNNNNKIASGTMWVWSNILFMVSKLQRRKQGNKTLITKINTRRWKPESPKHNM